MERVLLQNPEWTTHDGPSPVSCPYPIDANPPSLTHIYTGSIKSLRQTSVALTLIYANLVKLRYLRFYYSVIQQD